MPKCPVCKHRVIMGSADKIKRFGVWSHKGGCSLGFDTLIGIRRKKRSLKAQTQMLLVTAGKPVYKKRVPEDTLLAKLLKFIRRTP